jgi:hypothetical protein
MFAAIAAASRLIRLIGADAAESRSAPQPGINYRKIKYILVNQKNTARTYGVWPKSLRVDSL